MAHVLFIFEFLSFFRSFIKAVCQQIMVGLPIVVRATVGETMLQAM
jgi:hypothetical protein